MKNSYDESASTELPFHLFEWAVDDDGSAPDVAANIINESAPRKAQRLAEQALLVEATKHMADFGDVTVNALEDAGFTADFELLPEGRVKINFDDDDNVFDRKRRRIAEGVIGRLSGAVNGKLEAVKIREHANGGSITVGLMPGIGFGGISGLDPHFDPFAERSVRFVNEMDVNVDNDVLGRIDELTDLWDADYQTYAEGAKLVLDEMSDSDRENLQLWIEGHVNRVGVSGTTLEEVLHDLHQRISHSRRARRPMNEGFKSRRKDRKYAKEQRAQAAEVLKMMGAGELSDENVRTWLQQWMNDGDKKLLNKAVTIIKDKYPELADELGE